MVTSASKKKRRKKQKEEKKGYGAVCNCWPGKIDVPILWKYGEPPPSAALVRPRSWWRPLWKAEPNPNLRISRSD
jgi:hypothetical protein